MPDDVCTLPAGLPVPVDDGAAVDPAVWYPAFPPDRNAGTVLTWRRAERGQ